jgi:hypothetical protein
MKLLIASDDFIEKAFVYLYSETRRRKRTSPSSRKFVGRKRQCEREKRGNNIAASNESMMRKRERGDQVQSFEGERERGDQVQSFEGERERGDQVQSYVLSERKEKAR